MKFPAFSPIDLKSGGEMLGVIDLPLSEIIPDKKQPRKNFDEQALEDLASSIKNHGVIQPILVKKISGDKYQIIAGERRWRASHLAGLRAIPAIVKKDDEKENKAISLIENIQREELNPIELAESFYELITEYRLSHEAVATIVGKNRVTVTNLLRLLNLSMTVRNFLIKGQLDMGHARALLPLPADQQVDFAARIIEKKLTVRQAEQLVKVHKFPKKNTYNPYKNKVKDWIEKISTNLLVEVSINISKKGNGKVMIHFDCPDDVDRLIDRLLASPNHHGATGGSE